MNKLKLFSVLVLSGLLAVSCSENEILTPLDDASSTFDSEMSAKGNDAPSGAHYNLNIIGVPKGKTADMKGNNGHRIFVNLSGKTKIKLGPGDDFLVTDANGTDRDGASFTLPDDVSTTYTVWARALGNKGNVTITTCADLYVEDAFYQEICSDEPITLTRNKKEAPKFTDVSRNLLFVVVNDDVLADDGATVLLAAGTYNLFDDALQDYFWDYDNDGLKLLQLRFYPN